MKTIVVGRSPFADVVLADASVARRHAEIVVTDDERFYLTDCGTAAGTWRAAGEERWEKVRQAFVAADEAIKLGEYRSTAAELLKRAADEGSDSQGGAGRGDGGRAVGRDLPRGRVERDPRTGEIIRKRV